MVLDILEFLKNSLGFISSEFVSFLYIIVIRDFDVVMRRSSSFFIEMMIIFKLVLFVRLVGV